MQISRPLRFYTLRRAERAAKPAPRGGGGAVPAAEGTSLVLQRCGEGGDVAGGHERRLAAAGLGQAADREGDDGPAERDGLRRDEPVGLLPEARHDDARGRAHPRLRVGLEAAEAHAVREAELFRQRAEASLEVARADDVERPARPHPRHRPEQQLHALAADELPDEEQVDAVRDGGRAAVPDGNRRRFDGNLLRRDPVRDEAQIAYQKFLKWGPMRMQEDFARHLKAAFGKPIVVGRWCMNTFGGSIMATLDFTPFTHSDALDFLVAQPHYCRRAPGLDCAVRPPLGSFRLHGKMFLNEFDLRTWTGRSGENEARGIFLSEATDLPMWETLHRKLAGQMFANRMGWWYFDMSDNWFSDPGILADIASVRRSAETLLPPKVGTAPAQFSWKPSVAVVVD